MLPIAIAASTSIIGSRHKVPASLLVTTGMSAGAVIGVVVGGPMMHRFGWQAVFMLGGVLPFIVVSAFYRILPIASETARKNSKRPRSLTRIASRPS